MLRACFYLLATVLVVQLVETLTGGFVCFYLFLIGQEQIGACSSYSERVITVWAEMLATILALLLASRGEPPGEK